MLKYLTKGVIENSSPNGIAWNTLGTTIVVASNNSLYYYNLPLFEGQLNETYLNNIPNNLVPFCTNILGSNIISLTTERYCHDIDETSYLGKNPDGMIALSRRDYPVTTFNFQGIQKFNISLRNQNNDLDVIYCIDWITSSINSSNMYCGGKNVIYCYNINKDIYYRFCLSKRSDKAKLKQKGLVSAVTMKTTGIGSNSVIASGTFSSSIWLHDLNDDSSNIQLLDNNNQHFKKMGGITKLEWIKTHNNVDFYILSSHRNDKYLRIWDVRNPNKVLHYLERPSSTSQRYGFDMNLDIGNSINIIAGDSQGFLSLYNIEINNIEIYSSLNINQNQNYKDTLITNNFQLNHKVRNIQKYPNIKLLIKQQIDTTSVPFVLVKHKKLICTLSGERLNSIDNLEETSTNINCNTKIQLWYIC
ncbi:hypothetical protein cand_003960 [Cryptosporidium andersoni]|uniref:WD repeat-containing protein n=1 Tax=Cryptosporidium andersoni TaxID=117008 RepID=A0A1J4MLJ6_9CRYT|nr:hypothetical protein cand_003960 [Cryptosporidium andersoni]